jgi:hypothetical protein
MTVDDGLVAALLMVFESLGKIVRYLQQKTTSSHTRRFRKSILVGGSYYAFTLCDEGLYIPKRALSSGAVT